MRSITRRAAASAARRDRAHDEIGGAAILRERRAVAHERHDAACARGRGTPRQSQCERAVGGAAGLGPGRAERRGRAPRPALLGPRAPPRAMRRQVARRPARRTATACAVAARSADRAADTSNSVSIGRRPSAPGRASASARCQMHSHSPPSASSTSAAAGMLGTVTTAPGHDVTPCAIAAMASMPQPIGASASASRCSGISSAGDDRPRHHPEAGDRHRDAFATTE